MKRPRVTYEVELQEKKLHLQFFEKLQVQFFQNIVKPERNESAFAVFSKTALAVFCPAAQDRVAVFFQRPGIAVPAADPTMERKNPAFAVLASFSKDSKAQRGKAQTPIPCQG